MTIDQKKKLAAYYTPENVTNILSDWAIKSCTDTLLEPSFGGCNFLTSSLNILKDRGCINPEKNIHGFDIDPNAFKILRKFIFNSSNFILGDFLKIKNVDNFKVDVVLGNPPFVPIHKMEENYKKSLFIEFKNGSFKITKRSGLWVYFIVHSFQYLKTGGRMAWVVPDSISFTVFGKLFLSQLEKKFTKIHLIRIEERFFNEVGTHEKTSLLLCDGYLEGITEIQYSHFKNLAEALKGIKESDTNETFKNQIKKQKTKKFLKKSIFQIVKLKTIFDIRIGIVIGASKLLIFNENIAKVLPYFPNYLYPIVSKGKQLTGITIDKEKLIKDKNTPVYLIDAITLEDKNPALFSDLILSIPISILSNQTFQNRSKLFGYDDFNHPDAFLTYYSQSLPKLIINKNKELNCTNSVHRLYLKNEYKNSQSLVKFFALQTYVDFLHYETKLAAREYGNNILKFEPSDAGNIPLIIPKKMNIEFESDINNLFELANQLIEQNRANEAKNLITAYLKNLV